MRGTIQRFRDAIEDHRRKLLDEEALRRTIDHLVADGELTTARANDLRDNLADTIQESEYVLKHLSAHLGIAAIFAFDTIPLPLGTLSRVLWVAGSRIYESFWGTPERAKVHSVGVLLIAAMPLFIGYLAYVFKLRQVSEEAAYLYANRAVYARRGTTLAKVFESKPAFLAKVAGWFVPLTIV